MVNCFNCLVEVSVPLLVPSCPECKGHNTCTTKPGQRDLAVITTNGSQVCLEMLILINILHFSLLFYRSLGYEVNDCRVQMRVLV